MYSGSSEHIRLRKKNLDQHRKMPKSIRRILTPPINQDRVTGISLNEFGILDSLPWQLRECLPLKEPPSLLLPELILLAVGGVPDPIDE